MTVAGMDTYKAHRDQVYKLYRAGMEPGEIAGRTGVPLIRIEREMAYQTGKDPELFRQHIKNKYPSQRRLIRWPNAALVMSERERTESKGEY